jgi:hypothetical protein
MSEEMTYSMLKELRRIADNLERVASSLEVISQSEVKPQPIIYATPEEAEKAGIITLSSFVPKEE